jgi:hypothetical protein
MSRDTALMVLDLLDRIAFGGIGVRLTGVFHEHVDVLAAIAAAYPAQPLIDLYQRGAVQAGILLGHVRAEQQG